MNQEFSLGDEEFFQRHVKRIPGWLEDYTAFRTMDLLKWQEKNKIPGPLVEIGIYAGRYFCILMRSAAATGTIAYGIDTFQYGKLEDVIGHHFAPFSPLDKIARFHVGPSTALVAAELVSLLGGQRPRFVSIDGSHEFHDVFSDLRLAEKILGSEGIVAIDDYLNPLTLGVNQAVNAFFSQPRDLAPFAYIANKLFVARLHHAAKALAFLEQKISSLSDDRSKRWVAESEQNRNLVEVQLFGHKTLIAG